MSIDHLVVYTVCMEYYPFSPESDKSEKKSFFEKESKFNPEKRKDEEELEKKLENVEEEGQEPKQNRATRRQLERDRKKRNKEEDVAQESETVPDEEIVKQEMVREYLTIRSAELRAELDSTDLNSPKIAELQTDLNLLEALSQKLEDPASEVDMAVETAYQEIMAQLVVDHVESPEEVINRLDITDAENTISSKLESPESHTFVNTSDSAVSKIMMTEKITKRPPLNTGGIEGPEPTTLQPKTVQAAPQSNYFTPPSTTERQPASKEREIEKRRVGSIVIASAVGAMLSKTPSIEKPIQTPEQTQYLQSSKEKESITKIATSELGSTPNTSPERRINPIKRNIVEKERSVREFALKQALADSVINNEKSFINPSAPKVETSINQQINTPLEKTDRQQTNTVTEKYERPKPQRQLSQEIVRNLDQSSTEELLRVANSLRINRVTVRQLYERNEIDHHGLKSIVKTALRGGNITHAFEKTKLGQEAIQGRKIEMRHDDPAFIPADVRTDISDYSKQRIEKLQNELEQNQSSAHNEQSNKLPSTPEQTISQASYDIMNKSIQKKRIATITITVATTLTLSGASALAWLLLH
jgi:hypothetical protein